QQHHPWDNRVLRFVADEISSQFSLALSRYECVVLSHAPGEPEHVLDLWQAVPFRGRVSSRILGRKPCKRFSSLPTSFVVSWLLKVRSLEDLAGHEPAQSPQPRSYCVVSLLLDCLAHPLR